MIKTVNPFSERLNQINLWTGRLAAWVILAMMLITFLVVVLRYGFGIGSIALQEAISYCHAFAFLVGAAYTLQQDEHVRVDIFYQRFTDKQKAWVNCLGTLVFLLPLCSFLLVSSWHIFITAWEIREGSPDPGGLPFLYLFKGFLPLSMSLLILQALLTFATSAHQLIVNEGAE